MTLPHIIQGGMGAGVSNWRLARSVARAGQMGVVSGTALDTILVRHLQNGDATGDYRRALARFPFPAVAERVLGRYFVPGGKPADRPYARLPLHTATVTREQAELIVLANFAEVSLAREGHDGPVGINLLDKIPLPNLASLYGAMLAGVDYVLMGAGIPWQIPGALDRLSRHEPVSVLLPVEQAPSGVEHRSAFDPALFGPPGEPLARPRFLAIVSSQTLAQALVRRATGRIDGFIVEGDVAGGHNAPPRGPLQLGPTGEPIYGPRDAVDWEGLRRLGLPFWIAGGSGSPARLREAFETGAAGIQVGTLFALCEESGLTAAIKAQFRDLCRRDEVKVFTDPTASPTGFPFKVVGLPGTLAEADLYSLRQRVCDLGYLRRLWHRPDGTVGYRCPSEPVADYERKGGTAEETIGRKCLCNGLLANIGMGSPLAGGGFELPLVTAGSALAQLREFLRHVGESYSSSQVLDYLLA
ncbi:MAG: nitronate monooxygenase [Candidatus Sumerlaeia bacterium]|nr:nitronate monooxygenase [Candidatus Sumerlaeia bacterium]